MINLIQYGEILINALQEAEQSDMYTIKDNTVVLGEKFRELYILVCSDKGVMTWMDKALFEESSESYRDTVLFKLSKQIEKMKSCYTI